MKAFRPGLALALLAAALVAAPAFGQSSNAYYLQQRGMDERFRLDLGGFFQKFTTDVSLSNGSGTIGTDVNLEDDLGQSSNQTNFKASGYWRFGRHGRLDFAYLGWNRTSSNSLSRDITFGDATYHVGTTVDSQLRVSIAELYYAYSFVNNGDLELGAGIGVSTYFTKAEISGSASISGPGGGASGSATTEGHSLVAPIPAVKAYFSYALYPRLFLAGSVKGISATINGYHGSLGDALGGLDWVFTKNVGLGASYEYTRIEFSHSGSAADLALTFRYQGPYAYLIIVF